MMVSTEAAERFVAAGCLPDLDPPTQRDLLAVLEEHRAPADTVLLEQGRPNDRVAFLLAGSLRVTRPGAGGRPELLSEIHAPSMFGLTSFFRPTPPDFTVRATTPVHYLTLDRDAHARLRARSPRAAERLAVAAVQILADRLDALDRRITEELADHPADHPKVTEWSQFRARLFDEAGY